MVTGWIFLTENNEHNGSLFVVPGSHKIFIGCAGATPDDNYKQSLRKQVLGIPSKEAMKKMTDQNGIKGVYGPPGTVVLHECNISPYDRKNLFFVYNSVNNKPVREAFVDQTPRPDFLSRKDFRLLK